MMMMKINIYNIEEDLIPEKLNIFSDIDERLWVIKSILYDRALITDSEFRLFCLYLEAGSSRKAANNCLLKYRQIAYIVKRVKTIILENYDRVLCKLN